MRPALSLLLASVLGLVPGAAFPAAESAADLQARFVANIEEAKGHLLISRELYAAGRASPAALHSSHPVQELGNLVTGPIRAVDPALAGRIGALLRTPRRAIDAQVPRARYDTLVSEVSTALDDAANRVVPAELRARPAFQARVIDQLLRAVVEEYDESWKQGRIVQVVEYDDAWAFFHRAHALYRDLAANAPDSAGADFAELARAFPGLLPPRAPLPLESVKALVARISTSLATVAGG